MKRRVSEIAKAVGARVAGAAGIEVGGVSSIASALPGDIVFVDEEKSLAAALQSHASAVIAGSFAETAKTSKVLLIVSHPRLAFARAAELVHDAAAKRKPEVHPH